VIDFQYIFNENVRKLPPPARSAAPLILIWSPQSGITEHRAGGRR